MPPTGRSNAVRYHLMKQTKTVKLAFTGSQQARLAARLELPADHERTPPVAFIVFCHCFTCTKDILTAYRSSRWLAQKGYAVLRFDFAGLGDSGGDFAKSNFSTTVQDCHAAIDFLGRHYRPPAFLIGHSLGGTTALATALAAPSVEKVVTIAAPSQPQHVLHHFGPALTLLEQGIPASFEVAGRHYDIEPQFVEDVRNRDMATLLQELAKPVLIVDIENDALVDARNAADIAAWTKGHTTRLPLRGTDHLLSDREVHRAAIERISDWLQAPSR